MLEYRGFPGNPQPFQEVSSLCRISTAFPGSLLAFRKAGAAIFAALILLRGFSQRVFE